MANSKTVLVLGGGVGGAVAAMELRSKLPKAHRVVLVDRAREHVFAPSFLWLMTGGRTVAAISRPMAGLASKGIEVVRGDIEHIDPVGRRVRVNGEELDGDHLLIALGAELALDSIEGLADAGNCFYDLAGAEALRDALAKFDGGKLVVLTAAPAYKCPAAPYEAAMLLEHDCRKRGVRERIDIDLYTAEPGPMGLAGAEISGAVCQLLEQKGIGHHPAHQVTRVDPSSRTITFANGADAAYDLLAWAPGHRAPPVLADTGLVNDAGWVTVDRFTMQTSAEGVYAIGDCTMIPLAMGKPLPKAGVFAHEQAHVVAKSIVHAITGKGSPGTFDGHGACFIETGDGKAGFARGDFYAEPRPELDLHTVGRRWHLAKVLLEKNWLRKLPREASSG